MSSSRIDPEYLALLRKRGWIGLGIIVGCLLPFSGVEQSILAKLI